MGTVTQDFKFNTFSGIYGRFLVECETHGLAVESAQQHYKHEPKHQYITIECPEDIAMLMKLTFGGNLVERPPKVDYDKFKEIYDSLRDKKFTFIKTREYEEKELYYTKLKKRRDEDYLKDYDYDFKLENKYIFDIESDDTWKKEI